MITYLDGKEQLDPMGDVKPMNICINLNNKNYTDLERQKVYEAAKEYYSGLNLKWHWHLCDHEDKPVSTEGCKVTEVI